MTLLYKAFAKMVLIYETITLVSLVKSHFRVLPQHKFLMEFILPLLTITLVISVFVSNLDILGLF